jgi:DNA-directed RNA polymerase specialized sigma24 family protein
LGWPFYANLLIAKTFASDLNQKSVLMNYDDLKKTFHQNTNKLYLYFMARTRGIKGCDNRDSICMELIQSTAVEYFKCINNPTYKDYDLNGLLMLKAEKAWIDKMRKEKRAPNISYKNERFLALMGPSTNPNLFEAQNYFEKVKATTKASSQDWKIFELRMEGYRNTEISAVMGISAVTVKVRLHRLKLKIKEAISRLE